MCGQVAARQCRPSGPAEARIGAAGEDDGGATGIAARRPRREENAVAVRRQRVERQLDAPRCGINADGLRRVAKDADAGRI